MLIFFQKNKNFVENEKISPDKNIIDADLTFKRIIC